MDVYEYPLNVLVWISMESMDCMDAMESMDSVDSMDSNGFH